MKWEGGHGGYIAFRSERPWPSSRHCIGIRMEKLRKITKHISQGRSRPDRESKWSLPFGHKTSSTPTCSEFSLKFCMRGNHCMFPTECGSRLLALLFLIREVQGSNHGPETCSCDGGPGLPSVPTGPNSRLGALN